MSRSKNSLDDLLQQELLENYEKYYHLVYTYVKNKEDAQDVIQEGAYKAIMNSHKLKSREYVSTWVYRIMVNEALTFLRKKRQTVELDELNMTAAVDCYEDVDLSQALSALQEPEKSIILLRYFEELKLEQIAKKLNLNENTVKTKLYRTLRYLRTQL
ncbi:MAG: sigma-70 family RNA polymerase sigma factor [Lachnospiraceae bacterium]|nr:sigma-70 family RNA polymerase sigma factor [Lachnospiraceae bacterium]